MSADQKAKQTEICLLTQYEAEENTFLKCILDCDEMWLYHYTMKYSSQVLSAFRNETTLVEAKHGC